MLRRPFRLFLVLAGLLLCLGLCLGLVCLYLSRPDSLPLPAKTPGTLRVAAANLHFANDRPDQATAMLLSAQPDLLLLVEWTGANADLPTLRRAGYRLVLDHPRRGPHGLAFFVRDAIAAPTRLHDAPISTPCRMPFLVSRLHLEGRAVAFVGVHAPPPVPSCQGTNRPYLEALARLIREGRLAEDLGPGRRGDPVLLAGDLNAMPHGSALASLRRAGLRDLFRLPGARRLKPTWSPLPAIPSLIRLDYVLAGSAFMPLAAWTLDLPATDHRAVLADIALPSLSPG